MTLRTAVCAAALSLGLALPFSAAQAEDALRDTLADVRAELGDAMDTVRNFTAEERETAVEEARDALDRADAETDRLEASLRDRWADMSEDMREAAAESLRDLRHARLDLAERLGRMEQASDDGWDDVRDAFGDAWSRFSEAWRDSDPFHHDD